jgi:hypothetical protein
MPEVYRMLKWMLTVAVLWAVVLHGAAQPVRLMSWNVLNMAETSTDRFPHYRTVVVSLRPDILVLQEVRGPLAAEMFRTTVLDGLPMGMAPFLGGPDTYNALYYDTLVFASLGTWAYATPVRNIDRFVLRHRLMGDTLHVLSVHLKSSTGTANAAMRAREADTLLKVIAALPDAGCYVVCGDFNIYGSTEAAYQKLTTDPGNGRYFVDPEPLTGTWNAAAYAPYQTQSPRTRSFGGGASGGMDDRFDMILHAPLMHSWGPITYNSNSTWAVGNDGEHYNDSVNRPPNASVSQAMADALHLAADHLPVVASFTFNGTATVGTAPALALRLWPNPTTGRLTVVRPSPAPAPARVYDATGLLCLSIPVHGTTALLDLSPLPNGLYTVWYSPIVGQLKRVCY